MNLSSKKCAPCNQSESKLLESEAKKLLTELSDWQLLENATWLQKEFKFKNFKQTLNFVNKVGAIAEVENHHPDIYFTWGKCVIKIQTHKLNGLHQNDFILAAKVDEIT